VEVRVVDGAKGELTVLVDGTEVARKGDTMPSEAQVIDAIQEAGSIADAS